MPAPARAPLTARAAPRAAEPSPPPSDGGTGTPTAELVLLSPKPAALEVDGGPPQGPQPEPGHVHPFSAWRRRYMVALFSTMMMMLSADQNLLAPNLTEAAAELGLSPYQKDTYLGGYVMAAFFLIGAPSAIICGYLADKTNRVHLLLIIIVIGQGPCLCTYWVTAFWQFLLLRMLTGVAVGGVFPLIFSLLGDLFPASQRAAMASLVQIATGLGIGGGQMVAGLIGPAAGWRLPFVLVAAPSLLLAIIMVLTVKEPPRGAFEEALRRQYEEGYEYEETINWAKARQALRSASNWILVVQAIPGCLPWGVLQTYLNDYLSQEKGFTIQVATVVLLVFGIGTGVGVVAGGFIGQLLYNWRKETMAVMSGACIMAGVGPLYFIINADLQAAGLGATLAMSFLAGVVVSVAGPNLRATMINVNDPETRGVALAMQSVTDDLGRGVGPILVAALITSFDGRRSAFNLSIAGWLPCGLLIMLLVFFMRRDEAAVQSRLAGRAEEAARRRSTASARVSIEGARAGSGGGGGGADLVIEVHGTGSSGGGGGGEEVVGVAAVVEPAGSRGPSRTASGSGSGSKKWWRLSRSGSGAAGGAGDLEAAAAAVALGGEQHMHVVDSRTALLAQPGPPAVVEDTSAHSLPGSTGRPGSAAAAAAGGGGGGGERRATCEEL